MDKPTTALAHKRTHTQTLKIALPVMALTFSGIFLLG